MDQITKMLLFGEDLAGTMDDMDFGNFGLSLKDMGIEEADLKEKSKERDRNKQTKGSTEKKLVLKKKGGLKQKEESLEDMHRKFKPQERDLNLKLICVHDGEKIYKLTDLFIPKDERIIKKIEKYNNKIMTLSERLKQEKDGDSKEKVNEAVEIKHLIRKAKRNQKFTKINVTYNEKFFLENIATDKLVPTAAQETIGASQVNEQDIADPMTDEMKTKLISDTNKTYENRLLNSLFYVRMKLKNENMNFEVDDTNNLKEEITFSKFLPGVKSNQQQISKSQIKFNPVEEAEVLDLNNSIREFTKMQFKQTSVNNVGKSYVFNDTFQKEEKMDLIEDMNMEMDLEMDSNNIDLNHTVFMYPEFKMFSLKDSQLFKEASNDKFADFEPEKENALSLNIHPQLHDSMELDSYNNKLLKEQGQKKFLFKQEKEGVDIYDLFDNIKRKRHRTQGYVNENMLCGTFMNSLLLSDQFVNPNYKEISKKIFDMNDYNMNFEILKTENNQKKEANSIVKDLNNTSVVSNNLNVTNNAEDFFNNLVNQKLVQPATQQSGLKIGKAKSNLLTHAKCAYNLIYNKINLTYEDLKDFHRPNFSKYLIKEKKKRNFSITISDKFNISNQSKNKRWDCTLLTRNYLKKKEKKRISRNIQYMNAYEIFKDRYKLSLVDGKYCLFEHIDEHPLLISNFGMASKLKKFIYSSKLLNTNVTNSATKLSENEMKTCNMMGPFGIQIPLQQSQKLPMVGQLDLSEYKGLTVVDNKMYRAPVFYEKLTSTSNLFSHLEKGAGLSGSNGLNTSLNNNKPSAQQNENTSSKKYMNFLITFKKSKEGKEGFYIRELDHLYSVAQEEPKIEVYPPQSRQYLNFFKNKIKTYTYKLYDEIGYKAGINFKVFTNLFPNATEQILKKNFREMKIEIDKNICYFTRLPNEDHQMLITPENVCQFESCQFGIYKLREVGIKNLTNPDKISYATNKFIIQTLDLKQQFLAKVIEEELLTTPWNITQNFLQAKQIKGMLAIKGIGDPSNGQGGYSFLKMPVKTYNDNKTLKEEIDLLKIMNKNIKTVTGTDADLRKLSKDDIKMKLIQLGEDEDYISKLSRWERVSLLRYKSSKAAELGYEGDITKYARGMRMNSKVQRDAYQKNINEVFKRQIQYITQNDYMNYEEDSEEEEAAPQEEKEEENPPEEEEDKKKGLGFMRNEIYSNAQKKKKKESRRLGLISEGKKLDDGKIIKVYSKTGHANGNEESFPKIKLDMKRGVAEYLKRKQKSSQSFDNVYEYEIDKANTLGSRKRRDTPDKLFNDLIEDIVDSCIKIDLTKCFFQPVKKKEYPDYYEIIKSPIDLSSMKNKTKRIEYKSIEQFLRDLDLLVNNCTIYNGESHDVTAQAIKLKTHALNKLSEHGDKLQELEKKISEDNGSIIINS